MATQDSAKLANYVNFPLLKENLKTSLQADFSHKLAGAKHENPFAALGAAVAMALINPMVDALITPQNLAVMMQGDKPKLMEMNHHPTPAINPSPSDTEVTMAYENFDQFVVSSHKKGNTDKPIIFVLNREGWFHWKLTALRLSL